MRSKIATNAPFPDQTSQLRHRQTAPRGRHLYRGLRGVGGPAIAAILALVVASDAEIPQASLELVAKKGELGITAIRPGISINNRGTIAFGAMTPEKSTIMLKRVGEGLRELNPTLDAIQGFGVQINDNDEVAYLIGPVDSGDAMWCAFATAFRFECTGGSIYTYGINLAHPDRVSESPRPLMGTTLIDDFAGGTPRTGIGPYTTLGPALSINNAGDLLFVADTAFSFTIPREPPAYVLSVAPRGSPAAVLATLPTLPASPLAHPLISERDTFVMNPDYSPEGRIVVYDKMMQSTTIAAAGNGYSWVGEYPGISDEGNLIAFVGDPVQGTNSTLGSGPGLFLSQLVSNATWITTRILGTNDLKGTNLFANFNGRIQTCVQRIDDQTVGFLLSAKLPDQRVGVFGLTYDDRKTNVLDLITILEGGKEIRVRRNGQTQGLGRWASVSLHDSLNTRGAFALQVDSETGPAILTGSLLSTIDCIDPVSPGSMTHLVDAGGTIASASSGGIDRLHSVQPWDLRLVDGLSSDGVTRVVLRLETKTSGEVRFSVEGEPTLNPETQTSIGTLDAQNEWPIEQSVRVSTIQGPDSKYRAFAILRGPKDFERPGELEDADVGSRAIRIRAEFSADGNRRLIADQNITLRRPPVLLMHGIWSSASTWDLGIQRDSRFFVLPYSYSAMDAFPLEHNIGRVPEAIRILIGDYETKLNLAAIQVDYVGHSMGGLLGRLFVAHERDPHPTTGGPYLLADNYFKGSIHKMITVGTPHLGSELVDIALPAGGIDNPVAHGIVSVFLNDCLNCGAAADMRTWSDTIRNMPSARVPAHVIVGTGGSELLEVLFAVKDVLTSGSPLEALQAVDPGFANIVPDKANEPAKKIRSFIKGLPLLILCELIKLVPTIIFGDDQHDAVVGATSQEGRLPRSARRRFGLDLLRGEWGIHFTVTGESRVGDWVAGLLTERVEGGSFDIEGFPGATGASGRTLHGIREEGVEWPAPQILGVSALPEPPAVDGSRAVNLSIHGVEEQDLLPEKVLFLHSFGATLAEADTTSASVRLPAWWDGSFRVKAIAILGDRNWGYSEWHEITVGETLLAGIEAGPSSVFLSAQYPAFRLTPTFRYVGGREETVRLQSNAQPAVAQRLRIFSSNEDVVEVMPDGNLVGTAEGESTVGIRVGAHYQSLYVRVVGDFGDLEDVDPTQRFGLVTIPTGPWGSVHALNNAGEVLMTQGETIIVENGFEGRKQTPGIWRDGNFTPLALPIPGVAVGFAPLGITDTGVVFGQQYIVGGTATAAGPPHVWWTPTNYAALVYKDGSYPGRGDYEIQSPWNIRDSRDGWNGVDICFSVVGVRDAWVGPDGFVSDKVLPGPVLPFGFDRLRGVAMNRHGLSIGAISASANGVVIRNEGIVFDLDGNTTRRLTNGVPLALNDNGQIVALDPEGIVLLSGNDRTILGSPGASSAYLNNRGHVAFRAAEFGGPSVWAHGRLVDLERLLPKDTEWQDLDNIVGFNEQGWVLFSSVTKKGVGGVLDDLLMKLAPVVREQPISRTKARGDSVSFWVEEYSFGGRYQWRHNGLPLQDGPRVSGARSTALTVTDLRPEDAGRYDLVIVDDYGMGESEPASLTIVPSDCLPTPGGIIGWWPGDPNDQEAFNRPEARILSGVGHATGLIGQAFEFHGRDDVVVTSLNVDSAKAPETTWEGWILPGALFHSEDQVIFSNGPRPNTVGAGQCSLDIGRGTDTLRVGFGSSAGFHRDLARVRLGEWQHLALVVYETNAVLYVNGERAASVASNDTSPSRNGDGRFYIGGMPGLISRFSGGSFVGSIDEVTVYDRALAGDEIRAIYDLGRHGKCRPVVLPEVALEPLRRVVRYEGDSLNLDPLVSGSSPLSFEWFKDGGDCTVLGRRESLSIPKVKLEDAGQYQLIARNAGGAATSQVVRVVIRQRCEPQWEFASVSPEVMTDNDFVYYDEGMGVARRLANGKAWTWSGETWSTALGVAPYFGDVTKVAYSWDRARSVVVRFGGDSANAVRTWEWKSGSAEWELAASSGPPGRSGAAMAYDRRLNRTVLFGGYVASGRTNDTWVWDGVEWSQVGNLIPAADRPPARADHEMVYDPSREATVLFGGYGTSGNMNDTWIFQESRWERLRVQSAPSPMSRHALVYSPERESVVAVARKETPPTGLETWELIDDSWVQLPIPQEVSVRPGSLRVMATHAPDMGGLLLVAPPYDTFVLGNPAIPRFWKEPTDLTLFAGQTLDLSVCASAREAVHYQWRLDGNPFPGSDDALSVQLPAALPKYGGNLTVVASNAFGAVTSRVAHLTIRPCLDDPQDLADGWSGEGDGASLSGGANATTQGAVRFGPGKVGQAFLFGVGQASVTVPRSPAIALSEARGWTVEGWVRVVDGTPRPLVSWALEMAGGKVPGVEVWSRPPDTSGMEGGFYVAMRDNQGETRSEFVVDAARLRLGQWQHVALVYERPTGTARFYVDGALAREASIGSFRSGTDGEFSLGGVYGVTESFVGGLDEIALYRRALGTEEIALIHRADSAGRCGGAVGRPHVFVNNRRHPGPSVIVPGEGPAEIALLATVPDGSIRYSVDGSDPAGGVVYEGPFLILQNAVVRALRLDATGNAVAETQQQIMFDPTTPVERPILTVLSVCGSEVDLRADGAEGSVFVLERTQDFRAWTRLRGVVIGPERFIEIKDPSKPEAMAFYRLRTE